VLRVSLLLGLVYLISGSGLQKNQIRKSGNQESRKGIAEIEGKATRVGASERGIKSISRRSVPCHILLVVSSVVSQDPETLGGEPVFTGARVPVKSLFDHLQAGDSIEHSLRDSRA